MDRETSHAAQEISAALSLPNDWLNDAAKGYVVGITKGPVVFSSPSLVVTSLALQQLLAMKLSAWRDDVDIADAALLLQQLNCDDKKRTWEQVENYILPGRELKAKYAFEDLWESAS